MIQRMIPQDEHGYSVLNGEIHTRYASHATAGRKVRTVVGLLNIATDLSPCPLCYPPAPVVKPRSRKPEPKVAPVEVEAMEPDDVEAFSLRGPEVPTFGPTVEAED